VKDNKHNPEEKEAVHIANEVLGLYQKEAGLKKELKGTQTILENMTLSQFEQLTEQDVRTLVIEDKWLASIKASVQSEIDGISQRLAARIKELAERYQNTLGELDKEVEDLEAKVSAHLKQMGLVWN